MNWEIPVSYCSSAEELESVTLGNGITGIGNYAFYKCSNLATVTLPEDGKLTTIGNYAFSGDVHTYTGETGTVTSNSPKIENIDIPASVTSIGNSAFAACIELETVRFAPSSNCTNITLDRVFNCYDLQTVDLSGISNGVIFDNYAFSFSSKGTRNANCIFYIPDSSVLTKFTSTGANLVLSGAWGKNIFAVTNGGTFAPSTNFESGKLATPIKDGSKLDGWYTDSSFSEGNKVTEETAISKNTTYYAKWTESIYNDPGDWELGTMTYGHLTPKTFTVSLKDGQSGTPSVKSAVSSNTGVFTITEISGASVTVTPNPNLPLVHIRRPLRSLPAMKFSSS